MKTIPFLTVLSAVPLFLTSCVVEETEYHHRHRGAYYDEGPYYRDRSDVVIYEDDRGYGDHRRYRDRDVNRTNVTERNVYRTNVHENNFARTDSRRVSGKHGVVAAQAVVGTDSKKKHKKHDHDEDQH